jgi:hypothetical protein
LILGSILLPISILKLKYGKSPKPKEILLGIVLMALIFHFGNIYLFK